MALHHGHQGRHGMQESRAIQNLPTTMPTPMSSDDEILADVDEPPDDQCNPRRFASRLPPISPSTFGKTTPQQSQRKESLLTSALQSSRANSPTEERTESKTLSRGLSCASTCSNNSTTSTTELTSDGGFTSPGTRTSTPSPPLPSTTFHNIAPIFNKMPFDQPVSMIRHEDENIEPFHIPPASKLTENPVETSLGRKRCITFACGGKDPIKPTTTTNPPKHVGPEQPAEPKERVCTIKFACPSRISTDGPSNNNKPRIVRPASPAPTTRKLRGSPKPSMKSHRDSDSTVRNESPQSARKPFAMRPRKLSENSDLAQSAAFRFHEFASSEEEVDEWLQESTCHRSRLTITDTLKVENNLRQLGEEVEEEVLEDEQEADLEDDDDLDDDDDDDDDEHDEDSAASDEDEVSDEGFQTDDEEGFAGSDDDSDAGSDYQWWAPGRSTAATSMDHIDHIRPIGHRSMSESSIGSEDSASGSSKMAKTGKSSKRRKSRPLTIRPPSPELPDSTDFVCGTLDEDRPLEEAYMSCLEQRRAAKHKITPQDIDPTFPTSDPEMDEEDESDGLEILADESDQHLMMHGQMEPHEDNEIRGRRKDALKKRSPAQSPKRFRSPPPLKRCINYRSPPPRRLFGQSPKRPRSPPLPTRLRSPPPTRRSSIVVSPGRPGMAAHYAALAGRPPITVTSSLPRTPLVTLMDVESENEDTASELPTRGAIDIKIGLEKKRLRRREKLYQKMHRKNCKEKERRPQPGKGAERMREVGMELAAHKGKKVMPTFAVKPKGDEDMHMLSV